MRLYKYREVGSDLSTDYALDALMNSYAIFSSRKNFNDVFDSKIHLGYPTPAEIEGLLKRPNLNSNAAIVRGWVAGGAFTAQGLSNLAKFEEAANELIDTYPVFCVSGLSDDDQLWAHYAKSHTGFCIEFEFPPPAPQKVSYRDTLETIPILPLIESFCSDDAARGLALGNRIHDALHVKIKRWAGEHEYRLIAGNQLGKIPAGSKFMKVPYEPSWVRAIIFGCRATDELKAYIRTNIPYATQFKQAVAGKERIEIVDC